jgi:hypothetical protein
MVTALLAVLAPLSFAMPGPPPTLFEDFESGASGWTIENAAFGSGNGLWALTTACSAADAGHSQPTAMVFADPKQNCTCGGAARAGSLTSPEILLPPAAAGFNLVLRFRSNLQTECDPGYDHVRVEIIGDDGVPILVASNKALGGVHLADFGYGTSLPAPAWTEAAVNLDAFAGQSVSIRFSMETYDDFSNDISAAIDDVLVAQEAVVAPPQIAVQPVATVADARTQVQLSVSTEVKDIYSYRWSRNGERVPNSCGFISGADTATLSLNNALLFLCGEYRVEIFGPGGSVTSEPAVLSLLCRADINRDCVVNSTDVSEFINLWFVDQTEGSTVTDFNNDGVSNSTDVSDYINEWFARSPWC